MNRKKHTEESKRKMSESHKGHLVSEQTRKRLSEINKNKTFSEETRKKLSIARSMGAKNMLGKHHTEETRRRISESQTGKKRTNENKQRLSMIRKKLYQDRKVICPFIKLRQEGKLILPIKDTKIEVKIQNFLKQLGIEFFTHQYIHIEHGYQCDILIPSKNTIIECFGTYWHKYPIGREIDNIRCQELRSKGFRVFVFWENEIKVMELNDFKQDIDGEGSICLLKDKRKTSLNGYGYKPRLNIGNTDKRLLNKAQSLIGGAIIKANSRHYENLNRKPFYNLDVSANNIRRILPYLKLISKEKQRVLLLKSLDILSIHKGKNRPRTSKELKSLERIYLLIRKLNGKVWNKI